ncbi:hypothetical protein CFBP4996_05830 [Agrobacterium leguminum]|uniref:Uncharacterized protein n=1 Tax=Agrobacterium deltaense NCPPB 1641 TaxID=1183425 RepID=A0A1S7TL15_9HYPH|nr:MULTISPECIES: hypothetical protein [Agrobacterium]WFS66808.1 hypothetical protein CFBP4996_05830 [Agrobacterium leguminum]CVI55315.1 hypothetical protein AGR7A_Cc200151 [Agrobacterium deltaense NCPPB 1641]
MTAKNAVRDHMFSAARMLGQKLTLVELLCITYATNWLPRLEPFLRPRSCVGHRNPADARLRGEKTVRDQGLKAMKLDYKKYNYINRQN